MRHQPAPVYERDTEFGRGIDPVRALLNQGVAVNARTIRMARSGPGFAQRPLTLKE